MTCVLCIVHYKKNGGIVAQCLMNRAHLLPVSSHICCWPHDVCVPWQILPTASWPHLVIVYLNIRILIHTSLMGFADGRQAALGIQLPFYNWYHITKECTTWANKRNATTKSQLKKEGIECNNLFSVCWVFHKLDSAPKAVKFRTLFCKQPSESRCCHWCIQENPRACRWHVRFVDLLLDAFEFIVKFTSKMSCSCGLYLNILWAGF